MTTTQFFQRTILTLTLVFAFAATAMAQHDQQAGNVLIFNYFTSDTAQPWAQNTKITLTNTSSAYSINAHTFFINGAMGSVAANRIFTILPRGTISFLVSAIVPDVTGYITISATIDGNDGNSSPNELIGSAAITLASGHHCTLPAIAIRDTDYGKTAKLMMDMLPSPQDGQFPLLIVNNLNGAFAFNGTIRGGTSVGTFGANFGGSLKQITRVLDDSLGSTPLLSALLPTSGKYGWLEISARGFFRPPQHQRMRSVFQPEYGC